MAFKSIPIIHLLKAKKKSKYNIGDPVGRTNADGTVFDSKWEMKVFNLLTTYVPKEHIHTQKGFLLLDKFRDPNGKAVREIKYVTDFVLGPDFVDDQITTRHVVIDCKGMITDVFKIKEKMFMHKYNLVIHKPKTGNVGAIVELVDLYRRNWAQLPAVL